MREKKPETFFPIVRIMPKNRIQNGQNFFARAGRGFFRRPPGFPDETGKVRTTSRPHDNLITGYENGMVKMVA